MQNRDNRPQNSDPAEPENGPNHASLTVIKNWPAVLFSIQRLAK